MNKMSRKNVSKKTKAKINEEQFQEMAAILYARFKREERGRSYARAKDILTFLAKGGFLLACLLNPKMGRLSSHIFQQEQPEWKDWQKFNKGYLRRSLRRLQNQKLVKIISKREKPVIVITQKGREKVLKYALKEMKIEEPEVWDGKWRLIIYDMPVKKRYSQNLFRKAIKRMGLYQLQRSVFLTPYSCFEEVEFLRQYFGVGNEVLYMVVERFENDKFYRKYFGL